MRHLGNLDSPEQAETFIAYLLVQGIEGHVDTRSGPAEVWVKDEDQLDEAMSELAAFRENPTGGKYADARTRAKAIKKEQIKKTKALQKNIVHVARGGLNKKTSFNHRTDRPLRTRCVAYKFRPSACGQWGRGS